MARRTHTERAKRLATSRKAKSALSAIRQLVRALSEWDRLEDADAVGFVTIHPGDAESEYASDVLDLVGQAVRESGQSRVVEVFVLSMTDTTIGPEGHRRQSCQDPTEPERDSTPTPEPAAASRLPSPSGRRSTSPHG